MAQKYNGGYENKNNMLYKLIGFVYDRVMGFIATDEVKNAIISQNLLSNVDYLVNSKTLIHHSYITTDVIGYAQKNEIRAVVNKFFGFDFFFFFGRI